MILEPKEKAKEIYYQMLEWQDDGYGYKIRNITSTGAKRSALIAVDEMIYYLPSVDIYPYFAQKINPKVKEYWQQVKQEIQQL